MIKRFLSLTMILFFASFSQAQTGTYDDLWKQITKLESEGLTTSALEVVEQISKQAIAEQNTTQQIKSLLYKSKYTLILEEEAQLKIFNNFKNQIENSEAPTKNILENLLAHLYWQYFEQNRYQFYNRTHTEQKVDADDFRTWDLKTLFDEIDRRFQNSLQDPVLLQKTPLEQYDEILHTQNDSKIYRPTLFDFLNHNALTFYETDENSITQPAYKFTIDDPQFLSDAKSFVAQPIIHQDTTSLQLKALKIYQCLIDFHLNDKDPRALVDTDIKRLHFVKNKATFSGKDQLYLNILKQASETYKTHEVSALYNYEIAALYVAQGRKFDAKKNTEPRWKLKDAIAICDATTQAFPNSKGAEKCAILKNNILQPSIKLTAENVLPIQSNSSMLVEYSNLNHLKFKAYRLSDSRLERFNNIYQNEKRLEFIKSLTPTTQWESTLKDETDYQTHTTEVVVPKLNNGHYLIVATSDTLEKEFFAFKTVQVTNMALNVKSEKDTDIFQIIDRNTGAPIANAKVTVKHTKNSSLSGTSNTFQTNKQGEFKMTYPFKSRIYMDITVVNKEDTASFKNYYTTNYYYSDRSSKTTTYRPFVFTDRSIYRPGQTVYFKAIATKKDNDTTSVYANQSVTVTLVNVNGQVVKEYKQKTNDYGSVSGEFIIPNDGLTGIFTIRVRAGSTGSTHFSVEEYKRPKFETTFHPIDNTFKVNDDITITGNAMAYAGSQITDAKVVYRVHRQVQYPRWYLWYRPWFNSEPQEITYGETTTDKDGNFKIIFQAIPDLSVDKSGLPVFTYEITADVTDINGETRSATTTVNVGYHALLAHINIENQLNKLEKDPHLTINTTNLNGQFAPAQGSIKIYKLQGPSQVLRPRPWPAPDYQALPQNEFKNLFPHEAYNDEHNPENWEKGNLVFDNSFDTAVSKDIHLGNLKPWTSGNYLVVLESTDRFGQAVTDQARTFVFAPNDKTLPDHQLFNISSDQSEYKVGEQAIITLGSAAKDLAVTVDVEKDNKLIDTYVILLNNNKKTITIPVTEADMGGFAVHYSFAAFNSFKTGTVSISVPYPSTELLIETNTFRDKLEPGTGETWSFNIKGPQGDKISAELLAGMYDMSLDQFKPHQWQFRPVYQSGYYSYNSRNAFQSFGSYRFNTYMERHTLGYPGQNYDQWNWFGFYLGNYRYRTLAAAAPETLMVADDVELNEVVMSKSEAEVIEVAEEVEETVIAATESTATTTQEEEEEEDFSSVTIRKNLQETAFFFPQLQTDANGNVTFSFTTPEALTKWKLQLLAHTKALESATTALETVTQKELMVIPNAPRFLRHGDAISISTKIANLTEKSLSGEAKLVLIDPFTNTDITSKLLAPGSSAQAATTAKKSFTVDANGNTSVEWYLTVPDDIDAVQYQVIAKSGVYSDGEQNMLPVLSNRMLVTETLPMWVRSNETRTFTLDNLKNNTSKTLKHHKLTLEMTSNPAWYAVQALPYLMEYPYDCNEQIFSRYYANVLASHIANSNPRIKQVFDQWASQDALISNLEKNEELKNILIQDTPWLRDAQSETEQKKRIALLFDLNKMTNELHSTQSKLYNNQMNNGAWAWFEGGHPNRFITQQIIAGFGHLNHLNVTLHNKERSEQMIKKAITYLDAEFVKEYKDLKKYNKNVDLSKDHLSYNQLHYLYMRSFFPEIAKSKEVQTITDYYHTQIQNYWLKRSLYAKGLMALVTHRAKNSKTANGILQSLKENSINSDELGMYWKENKASWFWYQAPIETQALLIEAFSEIQNDTTTIDNLKIWLLKNKQTNRWKSTKATTEAVYALLLQGSDWLSITDMVDVSIGHDKITPSQLEDVKVEAGTGYYKTTWNGMEITPQMADVTLTKKNDGIAWGGLYWQYFEDMDKIVGAETPLKLNKKLFLKTNTDHGEQISEITAETQLKVGDLVRVRIELRSDRTMEFLHMKDMRAAGFEPVNVLSTYKFQDGLGYYESTKDAATNFFIDYLPKGVYVFEYDLRVNNSGDMSNGITSIECMYAPEFSSHSEGIRVRVE